MEVVEMKIFASFLLDSGLLSAADLADAMIEQIMKTPHGIEIIYAKRLITPEQLLTIITLQNDEHLDFRSACLQLNIWKNEFSDIIEKEISHHRMTLSQILIEKGLIEQKILLPTLKQYHAYCTDNNNEFALFSEIIPVTSQQVTENNTDHTREFQPDFSLVQITNLADYIEIFSAEKEIELELKILAMERLSREDNNDSAEEKIDDFFIDYHSLKGSARAIGAILTENIIHESEGLLSFYKRFLHKLEKADFAALAAINLVVLEVLSNLKNEMITSGGEHHFWSDTHHKASYNKALSDIKALSNKMNNRGYEITLDEVQDLF